MVAKRHIYNPRLFKIKWLIAAAAILFTFILGLSLVSLPFTTKQNRSIVLNTVEEEAKSGGGSGINEEHHSGKPIHHQFMDYAAMMEILKVAEKQFIVPHSIGFISSKHAQRFSPPPEA
ncbi:hypothetical protein KJS94_16045 [Flavihumibacter rivuli]|uniref:hypothetical protein n=1 Tax=Flavihumibacter rivuli TaxID=2838156 RepID=UPI001BDDEA0C|nr:hypothetical protein [Flavihumibacter rivuli]ULQ56161.1 hypothetical protein KJS94_16045 [Flavihumibacter rivuli]